MKKYWRTLIRVEVLTADETPPNYKNLADVAYDIEEGDASGIWTQSSEEVSKEDMKDYLLAQGSDPAFLIRD